MSAREKFEKDLEDVLLTLQKLVNGNCAHIDYTKAYRHFIDNWCPEDPKKEDKP